MAEKYLVRLDGEDVTFELDRSNGMSRVRREGASEWKSADLAQVGHSGLYVLMVDNRPTEIYLERRRGGAIVTIGRHTFDCAVGPWRPATARAPKETSAKGRAEVHAPMTGSIVELRCNIGDTVQVGQVLLVIESMKMNNELRSPASGLVEAIPVEAGHRVKQGDLLVAIQRASG
jgi:biotin carboxyl carrier protein